MNNKPTPRERNPHPLDREQAMRAARARLSEQYVNSATADDPLLTGAVEVLADELSSYGELAEETVHMEARAEQHKAAHPEPPAAEPETEAARRRAAMPDPAA